MQLPFYKYQGTGNDFILIDNRSRLFDIHKENATVIAELCRPKMGIGADGLILLENSSTHDFKMVYYNADGFLGSMCGNGGRCITHFAHERGIRKASYTFEAADGLHQATLQGDIVRLKMEKPQRFSSYEADHYQIDTGSPHYVWFCKESVETIDVAAIGREIRQRINPPKGTNVNFVNIIGVNHLKVRTYERGVEAETLSCGTGVTACAYIYAIYQQLSEADIEITTPGGVLKVAIMGRGSEKEAVYLEGPATPVFSGNIRL